MEAERAPLNPTPHPRYMRRVLARAAVIWLGVRVFATAGNAAVPGAGPAWDLAPPAALLVVLLVVWLCHVSAQRRREVVLFHNLGVPSTTRHALAALIPLLAETTVAIVG